MFFGVFHHLRCLSLLEIDSWFKILSEYRKYIVFVIIYHFSSLMLIAARYSSFSVGTTPYFDHYGTWKWCENDWKWRVTSSNEHQWREILYFHKLQSISGPIKRSGSKILSDFEKKQAIFEVFGVFGVHHMKHQKRQNLKNRFFFRSPMRFLIQIFFIGSEILHSLWKYNFFVIGAHSCSLLVIFSHYTPFSGPIMVKNGVMSSNEHQWREITYIHNYNEKYFL